VLLEHRRRRDGRELLAFASLTPSSLAPPQKAAKEAQEQNACTTSNADESDECHLDAQE